MKTGDTVVASAHTVEKLPHLDKFVFEVVALKGSGMVIVKAVAHPNCTLAGTGWQKDIRNPRVRHYNPPMRLQKDAVVGAIYTFARSAVEGLS